MIGLQGDQRVVEGAAAAFAGAVAGLGREEYLAAAPAHDPPDVALARAAPVGLARVDHGDAQVQRFLDHRDRGAFVVGLRQSALPAERQQAHALSGAPQVAHGDGQAGRAMRRRNGNQRPAGQGGRGHRAAGQQEVTTRDALCHKSLRCSPFN